MTCWLDVGLATELQRHGLPEFTPVDDWLRLHPDRVQAAHRQAVDHGADFVLTGTFRLLPHLRDDALELAGVAVDLAVRAVEDPHRVWLSIGPTSSVTARWSRQTRAVQRRWMAGITELARRGAPLAGVVLETYTDAAELRAAVAAVRAVHTGPLVACTSPFDDARLPDGQPVDEVAVGLRALDPSVIIGFNCGGGPSAVEAAVAACTDLGELWAKPNAGPELIPTLARLATRCRWVGGCCGVTPQDLRAARAAATLPTA